MVIPFTNAENVYENIWMGKPRSHRNHQMYLKCFRWGELIITEYTNEDIHFVYTIARPEEKRAHISKRKSEWNISFEKQAIYLEILFNLQCTERAREESILYRLPSKIPRHFLAIYIQPFIYVFPNCGTKHKEEPHLKWKERNGISKRAEMWSSTFAVALFHLFL